MSYTGQVINGVVVLESGVHLPEGATVRLEVVSNQNKADTPLANDLLHWAGKGHDLPQDLAKNHDHYLHGLPKQ